MFNNGHPAQSIWILFWVTLAVVTVLAAAYGAIKSSSLFWWLKTASVLVGVATVAMTYKILEPLLNEGEAVVDPTNKLTLPTYDYQAWHALPVEVDGRVKPLETAAAEAVWQVTGKSRFEGQDPVAVVLQWSLYAGNANRPQFTDWEHYPFIFCDQNGDLRKIIYEHLVKQGESLTPEQLSGKYISPADLRDSPGFKKLIERAESLHERDKEKASQLMSPEERKAEEVAGRLVTFDSFSQYANNLAGQRRNHPDPLHLVALDKAPNSPWFSVGQLRDMESQWQASRRKDALLWAAAVTHVVEQNGLANAVWIAQGKLQNIEAELAQNKDNEDIAWRAAIAERLGQTPQLYLSPDRQVALKQFQEQIKSGQAKIALDELTGLLRERAEKKIEEFNENKSAGRIREALAVFAEVAKTPEEEKRVMKLIHGEGKKPEDTQAAVLNELREILRERDQKFIEELKSRIGTAVAAGYRPEDPQYTMLHLDYLEARYPNLYRESAGWQDFPAKDSQEILGKRDQLMAAYQTGNGEKFQNASENFFATVKSVSEKTGHVYPGDDTIGERLMGLFRGRVPVNPGQSLLNLEMTFNHTRPFYWACVIMLVSFLCFLVSFSLDLQPGYWLGFGAYVVALWYEFFGFFARMAIAGRPPVSNMYETLIWVSFMSAIFALVLEAIYRKKVIAMAGTMVSTLALVLAIQLPVELGVKINPIVPVLRSNYWLTIHVLTIVSSYAGGTLAWGLGNLSLALLAFGNPRRDLLKTLSNFTYRGMQIAVLLLAAGTFLGGWWAAESWGRFWGWDPKEVWALIALVCYVIPLHARFIGWVKDFGLAVSAVLCYSAIVMSWYGVNFVLAAGLHSYGFGSGGPWWAFWGGLVNIEWVLVASLIYLQKVEARRNSFPPAEPVGAYAEV